MFRKFPNSKLYSKLGKIKAQRFYTEAPSWDLLQISIPTMHSTTDSESSEERESKTWISGLKIAFLSLCRAYGTNGAAHTPADTQRSFGKKAPMEKERMGRFFPRCLGVFSLQKTPAGWLPACPGAGMQSGAFCCYSLNMLILLVFGCFSSSLSKETDKRGLFLLFEVKATAGFPSTATQQDLYLTKRFCVSAAGQLFPEVLDLSHGCQKELSGSIRTAFGFGAGTEANGTPSPIVTPYREHVALVAIPSLLSVALYLHSHTGVPTLVVLICCQVKRNHQAGLSSLQSS